MNKSIKLNLLSDFSHVLYPCGAVTSFGRGTTDRTTVFEIFQQKKKLIDAKINYIKLLFFVELHTDINIDIDDFILL